MSHVHCHSNTPPLFVGKRTIKSVRLPILVSFSRRNTCWIVLKWRSLYYFVSMEKNSNNEDMCAELSKINLEQQNKISETQKLCSSVDSGRSSISSSQNSTSDEVNSKHGNHVPEQESKNGTGISPIADIDLYSDVTLIPKTDTCLHPQSVKSGTKQISQNFKAAKLSKIRSKKYQAVVPNKNKQGSGQTDSGQSMSQIKKTNSACDSKYSIIRNKEYAQKGIKAKETDIEPRDFDLPHRLKNDCVIKHNSSAREASLDSKSYGISKTDAGIHNSGEITRSVVHVSNPLRDETKDEIASSPQTRANGHPLPSDLKSTIPNRRGTNQTLPTPNSNSVQSLYTTRIRNNYQPRPFKSVQNSPTHHQHKIHNPYIPPSLHNGSMAEKPPSPSNLLRRNNECYKNCNNGPQNNRNSNCCLKHFNRDSLTRKSLSLTSIVSDGVEMKNEVRETDTASEISLPTTSTSKTTCGNKHDSVVTTQEVIDPKCTQQPHKKTGNYEETSKMQLSDQNNTSLVVVDVGNTSLTNGFDKQLTDLELPHVGKTVDNEQNVTAELPIAKPENNGTTVNSNQINIFKPLLNLAPNLPANGYTYFCNAAGQLFAVPPNPSLYSETFATNAIFSNSVYQIPDQNIPDLKDSDILENGITAASLPFLNVYRDKFSKIMFPYFVPTIHPATLPYQKNALSETPLMDMFNLNRDRFVNSPLSRSLSRSSQTYERNQLPYERRLVSKSAGMETVEPYRYLGLTKEPSGLLGNAKPNLHMESTRSSSLFRDNRSSVNKEEHYRCAVYKQKKHSSKTNLYIRGLPSDFTEELLHTLAPDKELIRSVKLIKGNEGEMYGFIDFTSNAAAKAALIHIKTSNRELYVNFAYESEKDPQNVYITNIPESWTAENVEDLKKVFDVYGQISTAIVMTKRSNNFCTGAGFVRFVRAEDAERAIEGIRNARVVLDETKGPLEVKLADRQRPSDEDGSSMSKQRSSKTSTKTLPSSGICFDMERFSDKRNAKFHKSNFLLQNPFPVAQLVEQISNCPSRPFPRHFGLLAAPQTSFDSIHQFSCPDITPHAELSHMNVINPQLQAQNVAGCIGMQIPIMINPNNGILGSANIATSPYKHLGYQRTADSSVVPCNNLGQTLATPGIIDRNEGCWVLGRTPDEAVALKTHPFISPIPPASFVSYPNFLIDAQTQMNEWINPSMFPRAFPSM